MNPYISPVETVKGRYDRSLARRILKFVAIFMLAMSVLAAASSWRYLNQRSTFRNMTATEQAKAFFFDWYSQER